MRSQFANIHRPEVHVLRLCTPAHRHRQTPHLHHNHPWHPDLDDQESEPPRWASLPSPLDEHQICDLSAATSTFNDMMVDGTSVTIDQTWCVGASVSLGCYCRWTMTTMDLDLVVMLLLCVYMRYYYCIGQFKSGVI